MKAGSDPFAAAILPNLDAAFNLARWMMGEDSEARDVVQTASLRALAYFGGLRGSEAKPWFLGIVRNCCLTALRERSGRLRDVDIASLVESRNEMTTIGVADDSPDRELERRADRTNVNAALRQLPFAFREVLVLREMEDLAYDEIAAVTGVPIGTVMSRLSRARRLFRQKFSEMNMGTSP